MTLTKEDKTTLIQEAKYELARREFSYYNHLMMPEFYKEDRLFLIEMAETLQNFVEGKLLKEDGTPYTKLMINAPPRHGKTLTSSNFVEWLLGNYPSSRIMVGNYNEKLSGRFGKKVRNTIQEEKTIDEQIVYSDIFDSRVKHGDASFYLWSLEGQYFSFLSTSPTGTATGFGANILIIDDLIKSAFEAYNEIRLDDLYDWYRNTMLSRLEQGALQIIDMTRWASNDLCGRLLEDYKNDWFLLTYKAFDGEKMLCDEILSKESYLEKIKTTSNEIASANYNQIPIDIEGRLYKTCKTYDDIPKDINGNSLFTEIKNYTDTADEGDDYLCSINYGVYNKEAYILDVLYTKKGMEITEPAMSKLLTESNVGVAEIESNNGGRGFARAVKRELGELGNNYTSVKWFWQSKNKKARIISHSAWVQQHIYYPTNWKDRFPDFYKDVTKYQKEGKNIHDDCADSLTGISESFNKSSFTIL